MGIFNLTRYCKWLCPSVKFLVVHTWIYMKGNCRELLGKAWADGKALCLRDPGKDVLVST